MYRLLIVDDEPFIVEGLRMLFENVSRHEFEIYTALSARDALTVLDCTRMDIVVSDIHMFGMDGLELLETVKRLWQDCRVVMLTGYSDFEYVQTALNHGADAYVLKTQDDAELLSAVDKCVGMIEDARCAVSLTELANQAMQSSIPLLQRELLNDLIHGASNEPAARAKKFAEYNILLNPDKDVFLVGARIDSSTDTDFNTISQVNTVFTHFSAPKTASLFTSWDNRYVLWILQFYGQSIPAENAARYISEVLDIVQQRCADVFDIHLSMICADGEKSWAALPAEYRKMRRLLTYALAAAETMIVGNEKYFDHGDAVPSCVDFSAMKAALQCQRRELFDAQLMLLRQTLCHAPYPERLRVHHDFCSMILEYLQGTDRMESFLSAFDGFGILETSLPEGRGALEQALTDMTDWLFSLPPEDLSARRGAQLIQHVHTYIAEHVAEDLSLSALAQTVFLSPVYLSRLYKQLTGSNLSEYVQSVRLEHARSLLEHGAVRVSDIAYQSGFESAAHFSRTFKKAFGITPQEYRNSISTH